jgi:hypothetical protein
MHALTTLAGLCSKLRANQQCQTFLLDSDAYIDHTDKDLANKQCQTFLLDSDARIDHTDKDFAVSGEPISSARPSYWTVMHSLTTLTRTLL